MTSVATSISHTTQNAAGGISSLAPAQGDDGFAAILGGEMTCAAPSDDANGEAAADASTDTTVAPAPDAATLALQEMPRPDAKSAQAASCEPDADPRAAATQTPADAVSAKPGARINIFGKDAPRPGAKSQPAQVSADAIDTADTNTPAPTDPILAQLLAAQQATPAANTPIPAGNDNGDADAAAASVMPVATSDIAAKSILAGGAAVKPGDADTTDQPAGSEKSQKQASTAAVLSDLGKARGFTDARTSAAHALPVHGAASDQPRNNSQSGDQPGGQQTPNFAANNAAPAPAPVADAANAVAPAHAQPPAPQPDAAAVASNAVSAPAAPVAASAAPQVAAQVHIAHQAATPDLNSLAFNIASKSEGGARHFDIRLEPAELGRVDVRLTVDDAGKAQATLSVEKPQTLELLQKDQSHLERALKDAGLDLTQNGLSFSLKGQQQQAGGNDAGFSRGGRNHVLRAIAAVGETASTLSLGHAASSDTRLDIRV